MRPAASEMPDEAQRHAQLKELFLRAIELQGDARARFVQEACASNEELRVQLESLLKHSRAADLPDRYRSEP